LARPLVAAGHPVIGVDQSPEMLARLPEVPTVCAPIVGLDLGRTVDAVLLASHLVNVPDDTELAGLLSAARRHLPAGGVLVVEWHPPDWFESARSGAGGTLGPASVRLESVTRAGDLLSATVHYAIGTDEWTQPFVARRRDVRARRIPARALVVGRLRLVRRLGPVTAALVSWATLRFGNRSATEMRA
jgi:methyltransferase family protein